MEFIQGPVDALCGNAKTISKQAHQFNSDHVIVARNIELEKPSPNGKDLLFRASLKTLLAKSTIGLYGYYLVGESYVVSVARQASNKN